MRFEEMRRVHREIAQPQTQEQARELRRSAFLRSLARSSAHHPPALDLAYGTKALAEVIAVSPAFSIAGCVEDRIDYISTAGGAFLEFLEGKTLPPVAVLGMGCAANVVGVDPARVPPRMPE